MSDIVQVFRWSTSNTRCPRIGLGECALCCKKGRCFLFGDNEGYSNEALCKECLKAALVLLERKSVEYE